MAQNTAKAQMARSRILEEARRLARSGQHQDCTTIIAALEPTEDFENARPRFQEAVIRAQLNQLCARAQTSERGWSRPRPNRTTP